MKTIQVSEATELQLDYLVAQYDPKCEGLRYEMRDGTMLGVDPDNSLVCLFLYHGGFKQRLKLIALHRHAEHYRPSTNWAQGGPIIERERIGVSPHEKDGLEAWRSWHMKTMLTGPTPLIAAMRCYVASKLGDTVDVPEEPVP